MCTLIAIESLEEEPLISFEQLQDDAVERSALGGKEAED